MKFNLFLAITLSSFLFYQCINGQTNNKTNLDAKEFAAKISKTTSAPVIDVRTPEEFEKGHLENSININWNSDDFKNQIAKLEKTKPVFVYCLSGGRSSSAANQMRADGFKEVYELNGGIMKWRASNLPETTNTSIKSTGMSKQQYYELLNSDKLVLIDFYADWCAPCKKMKPYLEEIANDKKETVSVIRINADDNQSLCKDLKIDALPVLQLYKSKKMIWYNTGYTSKEDVLLQLTK